MPPRQFPPLTLGKRQHLDGGRIVVPDDRGGDLKLSDFSESLLGHRKKRHCIVRYDPSGRLPPRFIGFFFP
jgi:hypothetical protein